MTKLLILLHDKKRPTLMAEFENTVEGVGKRLSQVTEPSITVIGPALDGGWGLTARHNGSLVHLGIRNPRSLPTSTTLVAEGTLYLDPIPDYSTRPLAELVREGLPPHCAILSLPDPRISRDLFDRRQAEWTVKVVIEGPGQTPQSWGKNTFFIRPQTS